MIRNPWPLRCRVFFVPMIFVGTKKRFPLTKGEGGFKGILKIFHSHNLRDNADNGNRQEGKRSCNISDIETS